MSGYDAIAAWYDAGRGAGTLGLDWLHRALAAVAPADDDTYVQLFDGSS